MRHPSPHDIRQLPIYSAAEAGRFLHLPVSTVRAWSFGQAYKVRNESRRSDAVINAADRKHRKLSFVNLVELLVLAAIRRRHQVPLPQVRKAVGYLKKQFPSPHPLADHQFQTDGMNLFVEKFGQLLNISQDGQLAIKHLIQAHLRLVEWDASGVPFKLHLPGVGQSRVDRSVVVIDPRFGFGRPVLDGRGVRTEVIVERFQAGETMSSLATDYALSADVIEHIIRSQLPLAA